MAEEQPVTPCRILFVCTGNTCRSPLAEALCKKRLAEQLGCRVDELAERGYVVASAGVSAYPGDEAAAAAVEIAAEFGAGLDVDDPIGADVTVYRACAEQIGRYLDDVLATLRSGRAGA